MDQQAIAVTLLVVSFIVLMVFRFPVALVLGFSTMLTMMYMDIPLAVLGQQMIQGISKLFAACHTILYSYRTNHGRGRPGRQNG